ncbi:hypothetical protein NDU88_005241 [Pleurodeles waltl]|uniref:Uncharacterized protein n=1 Tax=Pleurodeles waltl TaxID=8319 RepID=A0AAV7WX16_PLEWA|nr:hypothetical protein NDU88_005241 [Pleurodeles waltl]
MAPQSFFCYQWTTAIVPPAKPGSSVSDRGLTTEERREEREFQLQMARLKIEAQQEEKRAEREAKADERALAEKKLLLAHELSLKELEIKARQFEPSSDGGSIHAGPVWEKKVCIPKNVVPSFVVGDDIDKWLAAYEVSLRAHGTSEEHWGAALWFCVPAVGRDTLLTLVPQDRYVYAPMKASLLAKFRLTPEKYRQSRAQIPPGDVRIVEWVCMTTRSMVAREGSQGRLEPGTMAQTAAKRKGKMRGKPTSEVPTVVDGAPEEEEAPEPTGEDIADLGNLPELAGWQVGW